MINYDSIFNLSSGVICNWCIQQDGAQSIASPLLDELFFILQNNLIPPPVLLFCIQETICRKKII